MLLASPFRRSGRCEYLRSLLIAALLVRARLVLGGANETAASPAAPSQAAGWNASLPRQVASSTPAPGPNERAGSTRIPYEALKEIASRQGYTALGDTAAKEPARLGRAPWRLQYALPSWFNYQLYKRFHNKRYAQEAQNELHKRIYLRTALKVFEQRALYRAGRLSSLSSVNELSDLVSELARARAPKSR